MVADARIDSNPHLYRRAGEADVGDVLERHDARVEVAALGQLAGAPLDLGLDPVGVYQLTRALPDAPLDLARAGVAAAP